MKHLIILFLGLIFSMTMFAQQVKPTEVDPDVKITKPIYFAYDLEELTDVDTDNVVLRVHGDGVYNFNTMVYIDWTSGTAAGSIYLQASMDGVTYINIDTLSYTGITADGWVSGGLTPSSFLYPYMKYTDVTSGTSVHTPTLWLYTKRP